MWGGVGARRDLQCYYLIVIHLFGQHVGVGSIRHWVNDETLFIALSVRLSQ